jgi:hypothetical protein
VFDVIDTQCNHEEKYEADILYFLGIYSVFLRGTCDENNFIFFYVKFAVHGGEDSLCW